MNTLKTISLVIVLLLCAPSAMAQDSPLLFGNIEKLIQEKEPGWKLKSKHQTRRKSEVSYRWESGKSFVNVLIFVCSSSDVAAKTFEGLPYDLEIHGLKMRSLNIKLEGLGDKNYLWEADSSYSKGETGVYLRKGNVVMNVGASSIDTAKRFAQYLVSLIPDA